MVTVITHTVALLTAVMHKNHWRSIAAIEPELGYRSQGSRIVRDHEPISAPRSSRRMEFLPSMYGSLKY